MGNSISILFLRALLADLERLQALLGEQWPEVQARLSGLLNDLIAERDENRLPARVNRIYRAFAGTSAQAWVHALFQGAGEQARQRGPATRTIEIADPTTLENRAEIAAVARTLTQAIAPPPAVAPAQTRVTSHPHLRGEAYAYLNRPYPLLVKLSDQPQPGGADLSTPELKVPVDPGEAVKRVQVRLTAPDFDLDPAEVAQGWLREINFYPEAAASSTVTFTLRPQDRFEARYFSSLRVQFLLNGQVLGQAARRVEVLQDETVARTPLHGFPPAPGYPLDERGEVRVQPVPTPVSLFAGAPSVHLTIAISEAEPRERLLWEIASPYLDGQDVPAGACFSHNLGADEFVKEYLAPFGMPGDWPEDHMDREGHLKPLSIPILYSNLLTLRHSAPSAFWKLYELALERHCGRGGTPEGFTVLFLTSDTHVPWELMPISEQVSEEGMMPPLLGSAHCVGRWLLETGSAIPEAALSLRGFVLAAPTYAGQPLLQAQ